MDELDGLTMDSLWPPKNASKQIPFFYDEKHHLRLQYYALKHYEPYGTPEQLEEIREKYKRLVDTDLDR